MTQEQKDFLHHLTDVYKLSKDDFYNHKQSGRWLVKRTGIDKIIQSEKYNVLLDLQRCTEDMVVIKARCDVKDFVVESFGEASPSNTKNEYPVAVAQSRAIARVVLKLVGAYAHGFYSEDELD